MYTFGPRSVQAVLDLPYFDSTGLGLETLIRQQLRLLVETTWRRLEWCKPECLRRNAGLAGRKRFNSGRSALRWCPTSSTDAASAAASATARAGRSGTPHEVRHSPVTPQ